VESAQRLLARLLAGDVIIALVRVDDPARLVVGESLRAVVCPRPETRGVLDHLEARLELDLPGGRQPRLHPGGAEHLPPLLGRGLLDQVEQLAGRCGRASHDLAQHELAHNRTLLVRGELAGGVDHVDQGVGAVAVRDADLPAHAASAPRSR
jgi:hypothetical protein